MQYPAKNILINNLSELDALFESYNKVVIFGKGPTFKNIELENNTIHIGINETANILNYCDILVINDLENIDNIHDDTWKKIKYLVIPEYIHYKYRYNKNVTWRNVVEKIKNKYDGYYIIFNLRNHSPLNSELLTFDSVISGSNTANDFVCKYLNKYIKHIDYYGIAIKSGYGEGFKGLIKTQSYDNSRLQQIKNNLITTCNHYGIEFAFN